METDPQSASIFTQLLILLVLTLIRGYFAGAEMAVASVNKNKIHRLKEQGKVAMVGDGINDARINSIFICDPADRHIGRFSFQRCGSNGNFRNTGCKDE